MGSAERGSGMGRGERIERGERAEQDERAGRRESAGMATDGASDGALLVTIHGARGSLPGALEEASRYGAQSCSVAVRAGASTLLVDAGSGAVAGATHALRRGCVGIDLLLSHTHLDHVIGLPFLPQLARADGEVRLWLPDHLPGAMDALDALFRPPAFPVALDAMAGRLEARRLPVGAETAVGGFHVRTEALCHPGGAAGFRIAASPGVADPGTELAGAAHVGAAQVGSKPVWSEHVGSKHVGSAFAYASDHEPGAGEDEGLERLLTDAGLALLDCMWTPEEAPLRAGWGHGDWSRAAALAAAVPRLGLFHHAPTRPDAEIAAMERAASASHPGAFACAAGQTLHV